MYENGQGVAPIANDYELITHTRGGSIEYADQLNERNLLTANVNYVTANVSRVNNSTFLSPDSTSASSGATVLTDGHNCYGPTGGIDSLREQRFVHESDAVRYTGGCSRGNGMDGRLYGRSRNLEHRIAEVWFVLRRRRDPAERPVALQHRSSRRPVHIRPRIDG